MGIFEQAARKKLRFASERGELTVEHLWDTPLTSKTGFDLDSIAKATNAQLKASTEESFVAQARPTAAQATLELKLEILKHIISVKLAELDASKSAASRKAERDRLLEALAQKKDEALMALTPEELQKRIDELS